MEHARHVFRVLLVLVVAVVALALGRSLAVPRSYGLHGSYRFDSVAEQANLRAPRHGGVASCAACHAERAKAHAGGAHARVSCEVCHGPVAVHAKDGARVAPMRVDRSHLACARCHRKIDGRPAKFPQVALDGHVKGGASGDVCLECHDPHSPKL